MNRVRENISEKSLIKNGERILVSFSGGPDSTALLYCLQKLRKDLKIQLTACYINHNFRPVAAKKEIKFCSEFCGKYKIPFILVEANLRKYAEEQKLSLESAGRHFRLYILQKIARDEKCRKIAVGHHLDDTIETILFRLFRGTGPGGLNPIKPILGKFIRPLYNIPKDDIVAFLKKKKIRYMLDRTNMESNFSRNYIRNKIIPVIEKHFGRQYRGSIENFARIIVDENSFVKEQVSKILKKIAIKTPGGKFIVDLTKFRVYDVAVRRVLTKLLLEKMRKHPGAGSFEQINRINEIADGRLKGSDLGDGLRAIRDKEKLIISGLRIAIPLRKPAMPATVRLPEISSVIKIREIPRTDAVRTRQKNGWKVHIDYDTVKFPLKIRGIRPGDRFNPLGMNGTKKVGDYLTDKKCLNQIRDEIPLVCDNKGIIWLGGYEISDRVKINNKTKKVMEIELVRRKNDA